MADHTVNTTETRTDVPTRRADRRFNGLAAAAITLGVSAIVASFFALGDDEWVAWLAGGLAVIGLICGYMARRRDDTSRATADTRRTAAGADHAGVRSPARRWGIGVSWAGLALGILFGVLAAFDVMSPDDDEVGTRTPAIAVD